MLIPTEDSFRALARSSPWRWTSLHLRHRSPLRPHGVEAWLQRPGRLEVVDSDGREHLVNEKVLVPPTPVFRADGLVERRHPRWTGDVDPMWDNYAWVAMLDPVELSYGVEVGANLREDEVAGRPVWRASVVAGPDYEPRCGGNCCDLIYSEAGLRCDFPTDDDVPERWRGRIYPDAYDVALDVRTGIVVRCLPIGGEAGAPWLENDILAVDFPAEVSRP